MRHLPTLCLALSLPAFGADIRVVVAQDGTGDYPTVQNAVDHVLDRATAPFSGRAVIDIKPGTYHERVRIPPDRPRMTLRGQDAATTTISFSVGAKDVGGTFLSAVLDVSGAEFEMENLTVENTYGVGTQAVAALIHSDRAVFRHCRFLGMQDTLYAASGRQYYEDCYIAGHVDFIFGNAQAVFERCEIHSRGTGYLTAQSRTVANGPEGFVFDHCRLTADPDVRGVYLGRPWRNYSRVVYLDTWLGSHIRPEGWHNWNKPEAEKTAFYAEFNSTGPGAGIAHRVPWAHSLTADEARPFRPEVFLRGGDNWNPAAK
jgi:pectinesterase